MSAGEAGMSKISVTVVVFCALLFTSRFASADDATPRRKSRDTAFALSAGGTALSIGLVVVGVASNDTRLTSAGLLSSLVTPAAGEIYAGTLFTPGMGIRAASGVVTIMGVNSLLKCFGQTQPCERNDGLTITLLGAGLIGYAGGIVYDIATAGTAVDKYNQRFNLRVAPMVTRTTSGSAIGMGIGGSF
jgi:hypothetical protein